MKKESKEMLKTIISNQELIMKALKIEIPVKKIEKELPKKSIAKVATPKIKVPAKKVAAKKVVAKQK